MNFEVLKMSIQQHIKNIPTNVKNEFFNLENAEQILNILLRVKSSCACWEQYKSYYLFELIPELQQKVLAQTHLDEQDVLDMNYIKNNMSSEMYNTYLAYFFQNIEDINNEYQSIKKKKEQEQRKRELELLEKEREKERQKEQLKKRYLELVQIQHEIEKEQETSDQKVSSFLQVHP